MNRRPPRSTRTVLFPYTTLFRSRFRHILVDEFQDTNKLQYDWLRTLAGDSGVLFAVGDDDQSIYSWRGARVDNMPRLDKDFRGCETIRLEQNYRSTGRSEERRVGQECVSTCRSRWST